MKKYTLEVVIVDSKNSTVKVLLNGKVRRYLTISTPDLEKTLNLKSLKSKHLNYPTTEFSR